MVVVVVEFRGACKFVAAEANAAIGSRSRGLIMSANNDCEGGSGGI